LFLSWDVPVTPEKLEVVGYIDNKEACRYQVTVADDPAVIQAKCDCDHLNADGRDIAHIEIAIADHQGIFHPAAMNAITITVEGAAELIGIDNGRPDSHESFQGDTMHAYNGLLLAIIRAKREPGDISVTLASEGLQSAVIHLKSQVY